MKIKRFVAKDMRSALTEVKEFLGPDAIILSNKKVAEGVEIVAAIDHETAPAKPAVPAVNAAPRFTATVADDDEAEVPADSLKALLARQMIKQQVSQQNSAAAKPATKEPARAVQFERATERQTSGATSSVSHVQFSELTKQQELQAKLMQQQMDAMRNEMLSMRQLLQH
ncbi:MAG TPA: flagellar biosynthesis protein FlhF, partial [Rheinheimera sp.]|nr:flagellar biosynthesis protein FlhF [Rheinheimera sp.]